MSQHNWHVRFSHKHSLSLKIVDKTTGAELSTTCTSVNKHSFV